MTHSSEHARIRALRDLFGVPASAQVTTTIGDDATVLAPSPIAMVVSVDAHVEGVHFDRRWLSLAEVGHRATMAALSDLAAMGASALGVLSALTLPSAFTDEELLELASGQRDAAAIAGCAVVGGNLTRGASLSITTTVLGEAARAVHRSGARVGDGVFVAGELGRAAAGLAILRRGDGFDASARGGALREIAAAARLAFVRPRALIEAGLEAARAGATAMIDVSDGLAQDALHLASESGVRVNLDEASLSDAALNELARALDARAMDWVLRGGEDFALVATFRAGEAPAGMRQIGTCEAGDVGVVVGGRAIDARSGWDHFRG